MKKATLVCLVLFGFLVVGSQEEQLSQHRVKKRTNMGISPQLKSFLKRNENRYNESQYLFCDLKFS